MALRYGLIDSVCLFVLISLARPTAELIKPYELDVRRFEIGLVLGYNICYNKSGATLVREVGQGRNPAALSDVGCVLFLFSNNGIFI